MSDYVLTPMGQRSAYNLAQMGMEYVASGSAARKRKSAGATYQTTETQLQDVQFTSHVRHNTSKTGRHRPKTLKRLYREAELANRTIKSRFQCLRPGGFEAATGAIPFIHEATTGIRQRLPMFLFRLSSLGEGLYNGANYLPAVMYQMEATRGGTSQNWRYGFYPLSDFQFANSPEGVQGQGLATNRYWKTYDDGEFDTSPSVVRMRHDYTHIEALVYNQADAPCKFRMSLVRFNGSTFPPQAASDNTLTPALYSPDVDDESKEVSDEAWRRFWQRKLVSPITPFDVASKDKSIPSPFTVIKQHEFFQPSRTATDGPLRYKLDHFFRNDHEYVTGVSKDAATVGSASAGTNPSFQVNKPEDMSCPVVPPEEEIWLMCYADQFTQKTYGIQARADCPTMDIVIRSKHTLIQGN